MLSLGTLGIVFVLFAAVTACSAEDAGAQGWTASAALLKELSQRPPDALYEEERVPSYVLPDPLVLVDGTRVTDAQTWRDKRRPEILELFRTHMYGRAPVGRPAGMAFDVFDTERNALAGKATRKQVRVNFTGKPDGPAMDLLVYLPNGAKGPVPTFVLLNFGGNHTVCADPAIRLTASWTRDDKSGNRATDAQRGSASSRFPLAAILARGYAVATAYSGDIDPDFDDGFKNGVQPAFDKLVEGKRPPDAWGSIAAWAWGLSRAMDYFETDSDLDAKHVAVLGHSRLGKTSLWAGAEEERFAMVISNDSGCGGAALSRRAYGETVARINKAFPHWFCSNFRQYGGNEGALPVDQHMLIALAAPRPVYVASADQDLWADPRGEFLSCVGADPVYKLLGTPGLPTDQMPPLDHPVMGTVGYHVRTGGHALSEYDWERYMDFADRHFGSTAR